MKRKRLMIVAQSHCEGRTNVTLQWASIYNLQYIGSGSTCIAEGLLICGRIPSRSVGCRAGVKQALDAWLASGA
jgi:hypothetical protein